MIEWIVFRRISTTAIITDRHMTIFQALEVWCVKRRNYTSTFDIRVRNSISCYPANGTPKSFIWRKRKRRMKAFYYVYVYLLVHDLEKKEKRESRRTGVGQERRYWKINKFSTEFKNVCIIIPFRFEAISFFLLFLPLYMLLLYFSRAVDV